MGQFKPMVKMKTTEPSVELKLAKGGHVQKMQAGGPPAPVGARPPMPPARPSMATRRRAMMMRPPGAAPAGPVGMAGRMMKEGGGAEAKLKKHASMPASKAHRGLKTGGVAMSQGGYKSGGSVHTTKMDTTSPDHSPAKTGDVKMGNAGGFKKGGMAKYAKGGGVEGNVSTSSAGVTGTSTGDVRKGNAGGFKRGGAAKKAYATGGLVDTGRPVAMPQGKKRPPSPVSINQLSGTYKKGGTVTC